ncbi:equilibrative nucleobase transporter 1-like [Malaclemys terrapin pileata]|uniref:equilibrative nucleobase transporter 1-like n=1 Tax=Malaclemys terrapin pileata TaxID=2991368 RepID=UPI0023A8A656|nr:equilibrative nucleobase transporter 1-like [Malaclemys terrapin pileata]
MSFCACVFSKLFFWHLMWLSVMQLRHYLFIGTLNPMLEHLAAGDTTLVSTYTNAFAFTQLCGVLCAPWNGLILDRHKRGRSKDGSAKGGSDSLADLHSCILSLAVTVLQCVAFSVCASVPVLPVQYATFILQVLSRSFLYGGNAAFLAIA